MSSWKMKVVAGMMVLGMSAPAMADGVRRREVRQQARIAQGVRSGQLTAREAVRLECRQAAVHAKIARDRVDGGGLTARERTVNHALLNQNSRAIFHQKHDAQHR